MPRAFVLGNGTLFAAFDEFLRLRDFHYPQIGLEDHSFDDRAHRMGVYADGRLSPLDDGSWQIGYGSADGSLIGEATATQHEMRVRLAFADCLHPREPVLLRRITIENLGDTAREIKLFVHYDFKIAGCNDKDTAQYEPQAQAIVHYRRDRYFLAGGRWPTGAGMQAYSIGKSHYQGMESTFCDAEDGMLASHAIDHGSVDATGGFGVRLEPGQKETLTLWLIAGHSLGDVLRGQESLVTAGADFGVEAASAYWRRRFRPKTSGNEILPLALQRLYRASLGVMAAHSDRQGAVIASGDADIMRSNRDNYAYCWPRDGAFVAMAWCSAGYAKRARAFFRFCEATITPEGFFHSKYHSDGTPGSTWHPRLSDGQPRLQLQEDETALPLVALYKYFAATGDIAFLNARFVRLIEPAARFLLRYIDPVTSLPMPSYDLWEQEWGTALSTSASVCAGLSAAAAMAKTLGEQPLAADCERAARKMRSALETFFYLEDEQRFASRVAFDSSGNPHPDRRADLSAAFVTLLGVLPATDERVCRLMQFLAGRLQVPGPVGGFARFTDDHYHFDHQACSHQQYPGNPWIITTLWIADWMIAQAKDIAGLDPALLLLELVAGRANPAGMLPEQMHPLTGEPLAVAPLTWSHAAFVATTDHFLRRRRELLS